MVENRRLLRHVVTVRYGRSVITAVRWTNNGLFFFTRDGRGFSVGHEDVVPVLHLANEFIQHSAWSSDGIFLAVAVRGAVDVHDFLSKQCVLTLPIRGIRMPTRVAWSQFDRFLAAAARGIRVFDTANGDEVASFPSHVAGVRDMAWSPDSRWIATADEWGFVRLNDLETGAVDELGNTNSVLGVLAWSPCGRYLVTGANDGMQVIDLDRRAPVAKLAHRAVRFCVFQSMGVHAPPAEDALFLTKCGSFLKLWRVRDWELVATIKLSSSNYVLTEAAFHPLTGQIAVPSDEDQSLLIWELPRTLADCEIKEEQEADANAPVQYVPNDAPPASAPHEGAILSTLVEEVESASTAEAKGKSLEALFEALLRTIPGWNVEKRSRNGSEEFDLTISNRCNTKPHSDWGEVILVECKNRVEKSGAPDLRALIGKMAARRGRCRTAFLIAWSGFTSGAKEILLETRLSENLVVTLTGDEVRAAALAGDFGNLLVRRYWDALMH
jgi:WD40 repeat protein